MKLMISMFLQLTLLFVPLVARANDMQVVKPYSFSGKCSSQGLWTQQAQETTQSIRSFTMQLKDDPNCKIIAHDVQASLDTLSMYVSPQAASFVDRQMTESPQRISALRFAVGTETDPYIRRQTMNSMLGHALDDAALHAKEYANGKSWNAATTVGATLGTASGGIAGGMAGAATGHQVDKALANMGMQFRATSDQGLYVFNRVIDSIPALHACLTPKAQASGQLLAAVVKLGTAFAASNQESTGANLSMMVSKLTNALRELSFTGVLRKLNQADFLASMSCLVEMTTENYCSTRDSQHLYNEMVRELELRPRAEEIKRIGAKHVLSGYYILTQNIPMITDWIQRVQISVRPRLPTDATFQNKIFDEVNEFFKKVKVAQGSFAMELEAMRAVQDEQGRKNAARVIITKLMNIFGEAGYGGGDTLRNFFTLKGSTREIPFMLMGIGIPDEVRGINTAAQAPDQWLELNYMNHPSFNNPELLIKTVETNLEGLLKIAQQNAIAYYNKWFIVDKHSLVNETLIGTNYTVKESFHLVSDYLLEVEKRLIANNGELSMIASLQDTRTRIQNVINAYTELEVISKNLLPHTNRLTTTERKLIEDANVKIMTAVYDEFEVLLGKSGWFSNRVIKFIYADYLTTLRKGNGFGEDLNDLYYATGLALFDQMTLIGGENPAKVKNDLATALNITKMNLEAVEDLIGGYFAGTLADLKGVSKLGQGKGSFGNLANAQTAAGFDHHRSAIMNKTPTKISTWGRAYTDQISQLPGENVPGWLRVLNGTTSAIWQSVWAAASKVPWVGDVLNSADAQYAAHNERFAIDDEFGSARRLYEQFCIQSLAFRDVRMFYRLCRHSTLASPFTELFQEKLNEKQRSDLSVSYDRKLVEARENPAMNYSKRVCAFRDYNRKNLVMYLTIGQHK